MYCIVLCLQSEVCVYIQRTISHSLLNSAKENENIMTQHSWPGWVSLSPKWHHGREKSSVLEIYATTTQGDYVNMDLFIFTLHGCQIAYTKNAIMHMYITSVQKSRMYIQYIHTRIFHLQ